MVAGALHGEGAAGLDARVGGSAADDVAGAGEGGGQGQAGGQGAGDDAERAAGLVAGDQVPLVGLADHGVGQHADPVFQEAAVDSGVHTSWSGGPCTVTVIW